MSTKKKGKKKVSKKSSVKKSLRIGDFARELMVKGGKTSDELIKAVKKEYPDSRIDGKAVSWYAWDMRKRKVEFPAVMKK